MNVRIPVRHWLLGALVHAGCSASPPPAEPPPAVIALTRSGLVSFRMSPDGVLVQVPDSGTVESSGMVRILADAGIAFSLRARDVVVARADPATGKLSELGGSPYATGLQDPTGLALAPDGRFLYVSGNGGADPSACVAGFTVDASSGTLSPIPGTPLAISRSNCWSVASAPDGGFLYLSEGISSADGTAGNLLTFRVDPRTGALSQVGAAPDAVAPGPDLFPAHLATVQGGVVALFDSTDFGATGTLGVLLLDPPDGGSVGPPAAPTTPVSSDFLSELFATPDGRFVLLSSAGGGMAVYAIENGRALGTSFQPASPAFAGATFDPSGRFVLVADRLSDAVAVFALDAGTLVPVPGGPFLYRP